MPLLGATACDSIPAPGGLPGWNVGEARKVGDCEVWLKSVGYYHSDSWNMDISVEVHNLAAEEQRCGWSAQLISASKAAMTESVGDTRTMASDDRFEATHVAGEKNLTGFSGRQSEGHWVLLSLTRGQPIIGDKAQYHATPERIRPR